MRMIPAKPIKRLIYDCTTDMMKGDFRKSRTLEPSVVKFLQDHHLEYPVGLVSMFTVLYQYIKDYLYCKEIPLAIRFIPFEDDEK